MKCTQGKTKKLTEAEINWKHPNFTALQIQITLPTSTWHFNNVNTTKTGIREQTNPSWPMTWQLQTKVWNAQCLLSRKSYYHLLSVSYAQQSKSHKLPYHRHLSVQVWTWLAYLVFCLKLCVSIHTHQCLSPVSMLWWQSMICNTTLPEQKHV